MVLTVVFPWVPATAMVRRSFVTRPNTSLRFFTATPRPCQYAINGLLIGTAGVRTTMTLVGDASRKSCGMWRGSGS